MKVKKRFTRKKKFLIAAAALLLIIALGVTFLFACSNTGADGKSAAPAESKSICLTPPDDGSLPTDHTELENVGYIIGRLLSRESYHTENVSTAKASALFGAVNVSLVFSVFAALIGSVVCFSWLSVLRSYADLNASKMRIIEYIEDNLALRLYETEWAVLTKIIGKRKYKSFSKKERFVAILFCVLYGLIIVLGIIMAVL